MPPFPQIPDDDVKAIAEYIHSVALTMRGQGNPPPGSRAGRAQHRRGRRECRQGVLRGEVRVVPLGDRRPAGRRARATPIRCSCRTRGSPAAAAAADGGGRGGAAAASQTAEVTVTVTTAVGQKVEGRLDRIDDFIVVLTPADGVQRSFTRNGDVPKVEIHDPLEGHRKLLPVYTDKDIHDVTAYLVTLK